MVSVSIWNNHIDIEMCYTDYHSENLKRHPSVFRRTDDRTISSWDKGSEVVLVASGPMHLWGLKMPKL